MARTEKGVLNKPSDLKRLRESLYTHDYRPNYTRLNSIIVLHGDNNYTVFYGAGCLARLSRLDTYDINTINGYIDTCFESLEDRDFTKKELSYINWLIKESPLRDAFITKDINEIRLQGCEYNINMPSKYIVTASIALRKVVESPDIVEMWYEFKSKGLEKNLSLVLSLIFSYSHFEKKFKISPKFGSHVGIWSRISFDQFKNFVKDNRKYFGNFSPMKTHTEICDCQEIWSDNHKYISFNDISKCFPDGANLESIKRFAKEFIL